MQAAVEIRRARHGDIETLLQFEQGVINSERPFDPTLKEDPNRYYDLDQMLSDPDVELVVAELNGLIVGSGYARIESSKPYLKHSKHAYLGFMYVDPGYRGKGINNLVVEHLKQWSAANGITELRLEVYSDNEAAIKAYEKAGFKKLLVEMRSGPDINR
jgi:ribosomal protein S18 acetylase RimI-like enzyme